MADLDTLSAELREFGVISTDRSGETIHVQAEPDNWSEIEAVAEQHDWEISNRSKPRHQLTLEPEGE